MYNLQDVDNSFRCGGGGRESYWRMNRLNRPGDL
jgi:hypothetical protein